MLQTTRVFGSYAYGPDRMRMFFKIPMRSDRTGTVGPYAYGLLSFKRLSRLQKIFYRSTLFESKIYLRKLIVAIVQFRNKYNVFVAWVLPVLRAEVVNK